MLALHAEGEENPQKQAGLAMIKLAQAGIRKGMGLELFFLYAILTSKNSKRGDFHGNI